MNIHGNADSHLDALCHVIFDGRLYNGLAADTVTENGAAELSIGIAADGIVGAGFYSTCRARVGCRGWSRATT